MFCPNCGNETPNERAFCVNCGAFVRTRFGKIFSQGEPSGAAPVQELTEVDWDEVSAAETNEPEQILWPSATVFVPTVETDLDEQLRDRPLSNESITETIFEDAQADDFFEQSLSGRIRREDLLAAEPVAEVQTEPPHVDIPILTETQQITHPVSDLAQTQANFQTTMPEIVSGSVIVPVSAEPEIETVTVERSSTLFRAVKYLLAFLLVFAGGIVLGVWWGKVPPTELPVETSVLPVPTEPSLPVPPAGMAYVPGGEFMMGSDLGDPFSRPAHKVTVAPFFIDLTEVTNRAYLEFVKAANYDPPPTWKDGNYAETDAELPVTGITWYDAAEYAAWAGKRLPTEAEWELAARGTDNRMYPWGDEWDQSMANAGGINEGVRPVGQGGRSPFGIFDMAGNAWEWTSSDAKAYPGNKPLPASRLRLKIIRGGNWQSKGETAATYFRGFYGASGEREYNGTSFRCVKDIAANK